MIKKTWTVRVTFSDGDSIVTNVHGTQYDLVFYYRPGKVFNMGTVDDHLVKVVSIEFIEFADGRTNNHAD